LQFGRIIVLQPLLGSLKERKQCTDGKGKGKALAINARSASETSALSSSACIFICSRLRLVLNWSAGKMPKKEYQ
jgi:hypothetical protein